MADRPIAIIFSLKSHACTLKLANKFKKISRIFSSISMDQSYSKTHTQEYYIQLLIKDDYFVNGNSSSLKISNNIPNIDLFIFSNYDIGLACNKI